MTDHVDAITLEVVCEGLIAIVREMRATVICASYSPVIWDMDDFSCALFDPAGRMIAPSSAKNSTQPSARRSAVARLKARSASRSAARPVATSAQPAQLASSTTSRVPKTNALTDAI